MSATEHPTTTGTATAGAAEPRRPAGAMHVDAARVAEVVQTVVTGLMLAFIFRAFFVEPFIIPTGSMADSLLGAHATRACPACGWEYDFAPLRTASPTGAGLVLPAEAICPNCHYRLVVSAEETAAKPGDRVLVNKWPWALGLARPARWDVVVFRDPANAEQHYIKRVVGLPGESVEIVDGDVFIDGQVARKTLAAQSALWYIVFDQAHMPVCGFSSQVLPRWVSLDAPSLGAPGWTGMETRVIRYDGLDEKPRWLTFNADTGREYLQDLYAYDRQSSGTFVGDVRLIADAALLAGEGACACELVRSPYRFTAEFGRSGRVRLLMALLSDAASEREVGCCTAPELARRQPVALEFGHVDYRVYVRLGGREVLTTSDRDYAPDLAALRSARRSQPVSLALVAHALALELRGLRIDRDVHYTRTPATRRAFAGQPFRLESDEYFVLGDNSPDSNDGREWTETGSHLAPGYRAGTVPADQIVGQAAFVYLPGLLSPDARGRWAVPNVGRVRFVR